MMSLSAGGRSIFVRIISGVICKYRKAANVHYVCARALSSLIKDLVIDIQLDVVLMSCGKGDDTYCKVG